MVTILRYLAVLAAATTCAACGQFQEPPRIQPPRDSYTPARLTVVIDGASEVVDGAVVSPPFFAADGVRPLLGRFFIAPEYSTGQEAIAVLSHEYWTRRFGSSPTVIGTRLIVDGRPRVIVGVGPPAFQPGQGGSVWIPKEN